MLYLIFRNKHLCAFIFLFLFLRKLNGVTNEKQKSVPELNTPLNLQSELYESSPNTAWLHGHLFSPNTLQIVPAPREVQPFDGRSETKENPSSKRKVSDASWCGSLDMLFPPPELSPLQPPAVLWLRLAPHLGLSWLVMSSGQSTWTHCLSWPEPKVYYIPH